MRCAQRLVVVGAWKHTLELCMFYRYRHYAVDSKRKAAVLLALCYLDPRYDLESESHALSCSVHITA